MTENEIRVWLKSIKLDTDEMRKIFEQIAELRAIAESCTVRTDKESIQSSGSGDKMARVVGKIVDLERKISHSEKIVAKRRKEFEEISGKMSDDRQRDFLTTRYYDGNSFYETVMILDLSDSTARRVEKRAISEFTKLKNDHDTIFSV